MELPEDMKEALRARANIAENDSSEDDIFESMSPDEIVQEVAGWFLGDPGWAGTFKRWFKAVGLIPEAPK